MRGLVVDIEPIGERGPQIAHFSLAKRVLQPSRRTASLIAGKSDSALIWIRSSAWRMWAASVWGWPTHRRRV